MHADRGSSMRSKPVAALLVDLEVAKTHSRSHVSDDNPYAEAPFKTLKYRPDFPERFGSLEDARVHVLFAQRVDILNVAFLANPKRFKGSPSQPPRLPPTARIHPPKQETTTPDSSHATWCFKVIGTLRARLAISHNPRDA